MRVLLHALVQERLTAQAAVAAITCYDAATAISVVEAAESCALPVVILVPPSLPRGPEGLRTIRAFRSIADDTTVPCVVQLDHTRDREVIRACLGAGVDAVMADGSESSNGDNADLVRSVRDQAGPEVTIEAELGNIAGDEDRSIGVDPDVAGLTDPDEVEAFVAASRCDLLAVAVGNVHGRYRGEAVVDTPRLAAIRAVAGVPLVLHRASGLPARDLARAGALGVGKVNINTELRRVVLDSINAELPTARGAGDDLAHLSLARSHATRTFVTETLGRLAGLAHVGGPG